MLIENDGALLHFAHSLLLDISNRTYIYVNINYQYQVPILHPEYSPGVTKPSSRGIVGRLEGMITYLTTHDIRFLIGLLPFQSADLTLGRLKVGTDERRPLNVIFYSARQLL